MSPWVFGINLFSQPGEMFRREGVWSREGEGECKQEDIKEVACSSKKVACLLILQAVH